MDADLKMLLGRLTVVVEKQAQQISDLQVTQAESLKAFQQAIGGMRGDRPELAFQALAESIELFTFDPDNDMTFERWYGRHGDLLQQASLDERGRTRLLLQRLDGVAYKRYSDFVLPALPKDRSYEDTVATLKSLFDRPESLFCARFKCFQMSMAATEDMSTYAARVNKSCEDFKLSELTIDLFKSLIFILGLRDERWKDIRTRLHNFVDVDPTKGSLEKLVGEATRLQTLKADVRLGASSSHDMPSIAAVRSPHHSVDRKLKHSHRQKGRKQPPKQKLNSPAPKYPCSRCGGLHFTRDCEYQSRTCPSCSEIGHKDGYCLVAANIGKSSKKSYRGDRVHCKLLHEGLFRITSWLI